MAGSRRVRPPRTPRSPDVLPAEGYAGEFPPLPASYRVFDGAHERTVRYLAATRDWYATWARSPMATRFAPTDWNRLLMIAPLVDRFWRSSSKDLAAEIRQQEALLGGTVGDRARLGVTIEESEPAPVADIRVAAVERRRRLTSVDRAE